MKLFFISLPLLLLSCLQTVDQASQDLSEIANPFLLSLTEKKVYIGKDDEQGHAANITALQIAKREGFGQAVALKDGKDLNDAQPLLLANIIFEFNKDSKTYDCELKNKNLLYKMTFDLGEDCDIRDDVVISWTECGKLLIKKVDYVAARWYQYKKNKDINLMVGEYKSVQRKKLKSTVSAAGKRNSSDNGSFEAAKSYLNKWRITCEENSNGLILLFPAAYGHEDYKEIKLDCCENVDRLTVHIGLSEANSKELAITITLYKEGGKNVYHAFDLDDKGAIKKHFEVVGAGGNEKVILNDYKKNPTGEEVRETAN